MDGRMHEGAEGTIKNKPTACHDASPNKSKSTLRGTTGTNGTGDGKKEEGQEYGGCTLKV